MFKRDPENIDRGVLFFLVYVWLHIQRGPDGECWEWIGGRDSDGYGVMQYNNHPVRVIKIVYTLTKGDIPEGLDVLHGCEGRYPPGDTSYRACCNPAHLSVGTAAENVRQMFERGRQGPRGKKNLTYEIAEEIRLVFARSYGNADRNLLAAKYNISRQMLGRILKRKSWANPPSQPDCTFPISGNSLFDKRDGLVSRG